MSPLLPSPDDRLSAIFTLDTPRLRLRRFELSDVPRVRELADHPDVAATTLNLAQPYALADANAFVRGARMAWTKAESVVFAVEVREDASLIGTVGLTVSASHDRAEVGYWFGRAYWGCGYATEAGRAVVRFGFEALGLNRIFATCFADNPASERVLQKLGLRCEGTMRQHYKRFGLYHDGRLYGLLKVDWLTLSEPL